MRFNGGSNAGHTVINSHGTFKLHLTPCGIFNPNAINLIGTGTVVDFDSLKEEVSALSSAGVSVEGLHISSRAHVIMPYHRLLDGLSEEARGDGAIGTTRRGVGPAYMDKAERIGIQVGDLLDDALLRSKLESVARARNPLLAAAYGQPPLDVDALVGTARGWREQFGSMVVDHVLDVQRALDAGEHVLLEGQLGALRDLDWGTYPFVTSSTTVAGGGAVGGGVPVRHITEIIGVVKAYTSAVGEGPVPTELGGDDGETLREQGEEYGATTGRPRRVGWFDAVATRYAHAVNGFTGIAVTKLDVLDGMPLIRLCSAYHSRGERWTTVPPTPVLAEATPEYEEFEGWLQPTSGARRWDELPGQAQRYLNRIEELVGAPIRIVSVGPDRDQTIFCD
jgi:adenylosuccinate synthase